MDQNLPIEQAHSFSTSDDLQKEFAKYREFLQICRLHLTPNAQKLSASGGLRPPDSPTSGSALDPAGASPQTPITALAMCAVPTVLTRPAVATWLAVAYWPVVSSHCPSMSFSNCCLFDIPCSISSWLLACQLLCNTRKSY